MSRLFEYNIKPFNDKIASLALKTVDTSKKVDALLAKPPQDFSVPKQAIESLAAKIDGCQRRIEDHESRLRELEERPMSQETNGDLLIKLSDSLKQLKHRIAGVEKHTHPNFELLLSNLKDSLNQEIREQARIESESRQRDAELMARAAHND